MEADLYTNVLSHYEDNASHSDSEMESQDSWAEGEAPEQIKGLTLDDNEKAVEAEEVRQESDIRELLPEGEDDDYDVDISNDDDDYDGSERRSIKEYDQEVKEGDDTSDLKVPELLEHPTVDITRDPSISSRISSDMDIFSTRTPTTSSQQSLKEPPNNFQQFTDKNQNKTRTSTMTSTVTSQFQPPNNMNQFVNNAGYSQSIYSTDIGDDDLESQFSYLPNDDKPWEIGYNPPKIPISKVQTTDTMGTSSAESLMKFESQLNHNRQAFSNNEDIISTDQQSVTTIDEDNDDNDETDHEEEYASIIDNRTLKSGDTSTHNDEADDSHLSASTAPTADTGNSQLKKTTSKTSTSNKELYLKSVLPIVQAKTSNSQKIVKIKELRLEQSKHDTMLSNWLITQTELAKSTASTRQADLGPNVKTALNTKYTGGSPMVPNAGIGLGYGISAGLDSTKSKVADVGEGLHRGMQSLGRVAKGFVGSESGPKHLFRRKDSRR